MARRRTPPSKPKWFQRSPIDITDSIPAILPALSFRYSKCVVGDLKPDPEPEHGHNVFVPKSAGELMFEGQLCPLVKLHFHAKSEHHIAGNEFPLELHLVHSIPAGKSLSKFVVVGVLFQTATRKAPDVSTPASLASFAKSLSARRDGEHTDPFDLTHLLPNDPLGYHAYYRYEGSLTTGDLDEVVSWIVLRHPLKVILSDVKPLIDAASHPDLATQDVNRRFVLRNF